MLANVCIFNKALKGISMMEQEILRLRDDLISNDKEKALSAYKSLFKLGYEAIPYLLEEANNIEISPIQITVPPVLSIKMPKDYQQTKGTVVLYLIEAIRINVMFHSIPVISYEQEYSWKDIIRQQITNQKVACCDYLRWWEKYKETGDANKDKQVVPWSGWRRDASFDNDKWLRKWIR